VENLPREWKALAPVPAPLRRALIEAMGGWGPFTVREIANLFEDHDLARERGRASKVTLGWASVPE